MRFHTWMGITFAVFFVALGLPLAGLAQKFQEPTQNELRMTDDPKAPGAAAVFLDREEVTDNFSHYASCYARIKVLTDAGKEWATTGTSPGAFLFKPDESVPGVLRRWAYFLAMDVTASITSSAS